jgi:hypothetical protein
MKCRPERRSKPRAAEPGLCPVFAQESASPQSGVKECWSDEVVGSPTARPSKVPTLQHSNTAASQRSSTPPLQHSTTRSCCLLLGGILLLTPGWARAQLLPEQNAEDYFHRGAQFYVHGKKPEAKTEIFNGLKLYPSDALLNGMAGLLLKEEEKQQQQQQQNQSNQDQNKDQQQQQQQQQQKPDDQKQQQQQQQQAGDRSKEQDQKQQQQAQQAAGQPKDDKDQKGDQAEAAAAPGQMTPEQAKQLLDAEKGEEQLLQLKPEQKPQDRSRPFKDW